MRLGSRTVPPSIRGTPNLGVNEGPGGKMRENEG